MRSKAFTRFTKKYAATTHLMGTAIVVVVGVALFVAGLAVSFRLILEPFAIWISGVWNSAIGRFVPRESIAATNHLLGGTFILLGALVALYGARRFMRRVAHIIDPSTASTGVVNRYIQRLELARAPKIVALGGGTGLSTLLRGLTGYTSNITAIVTVTDDGGSSGALRAEYSIAPPGDIRNCLVALAESESGMSALFNHRFVNGSLQNHTVGNIMMVGLMEQSKGNLDQAVQLASKVLAVQGKVIPATLDHVTLRAIMDDGQEICGETKIVAARKKIRRIYLEPPDVKAHPSAVEAIEEADLVVIGPGSVFTSVIPNLLVPGIAEAIARSKAKSVYICNVMTQPGESDSFSAAEHVMAIEANVSGKFAQKVLVNTARPSEEALEKYKAQGQSFVQPDSDRIRENSYGVIEGDFMNVSDYVRHDAVALAMALDRLARK